MTLKVDLSDDTLQKLRASADARGMTVEELASVELDQLAVRLTNEADSSSSATDTGPFDKWIGAFSSGGALDSASIDRDLADSYDCPNNPKQGS